MFRKSKLVVVALTALALWAGQAAAQSVGGVSFQWLRVEPSAKRTNFYGLFVNNNPTCKKVAFSVLVDGKPGFSETLAINGNASATYNFTNDYGASTQLVIGNVSDC